MNKLLLTVAAIMAVLPAVANDRPTIDRPTQCQPQVQNPTVIIPNRLSRRWGSVDTQPYMGGQWFTTYNAYGDNIRLKDADLFAGTNEATAKKIGGITFTYDEEGYESSRDETYIWGWTQAGNYILGKSHQEEDNSHRNLIFWVQDSMTGEWNLWSSDYCIHSPYGGDLESEYRYFNEDLGRVITQSKVVSQYDDSNRPIETIYYSNSDVNQDSLVPSYRLTYEYDESGEPLIGEYFWRYDNWDSWSARRVIETENSITNEEYYWNEYQGRWLPRTKTYQEYENNQMTLKIEYNGSYDGGWTPYRKETSVWNTRFYETENKQYSWSYSTQDWFLSEEHHTEFLPGDTVSTAYWVIYYSDGSYMDSNTEYQSQYSQPEATGERREFASDQFGRQTMGATYLLATLTPLTWEGLEKIELDYNDPTGESLTPEVSVSYSWDRVAGQWVYSQKNIFRSDETENLSEGLIWDGTAWVVDHRYWQKFIVIGKTTYTYYDEMFSSWYGDYSGNRTERTFDAAGNMLTEEKTEWNNETKAWEYGSIEKNEYDASGAVSQSEKYEYLADENMWRLDKTVNEVNTGENASYFYCGKGAAIDGIVPRLYEYSIRKYNAHGLVTFNEEKQSDVEWGTCTVTWISGTRIELSYNEQDSITGLTIRNFDADSQEFVNSSRQELSYGQGLLGPSLTGQTIYTWNPDDEKWDTVAYAALRLEGNTQYLEIFSFDGENWSVSACTSTTLDPASGSMTVERLEYDGDSMVPMERIETIVIANGNETRHSYYYGSDQGWQLEEKTINTNVDGLITYEHYRWNGWELIGDEKKLERLDANGYRIYGESFFWSLNDWVSNEKRIAQFDPQGGLLSEEIYRWNQSEEYWYGISKQENAFDELHNNIMWANYSWDRNAKAWVGYAKQVTVKDTLGNTLLYERYSGMRDGKWLGMEKYENAYDSEGRQTMYAIYDFDKERMDWRGDNKQEYGYDEDGSDCMYATYIWDDDAWTWTGDYKRTYLYFEGGSTDEKYRWDKSTGTWVEDIRSSWHSIYEEFSESSVNDVWKWKNGQWVEDSRESTIYQYSPDYNIMYCLETTEKSYGGQWTCTDYRKLVYNYTDATAVKAAKAAANASVSVSDGVITVISHADITVMTATGQIIATGHGSVSVNVPSGTYLIRSGSETFKIARP